MAFLTPLFLVGLAALVVPILIHLQRRHEVRAQSFPSLMFLESIPIASMRRRWIRNWLLLALRCLAISLLALAFARPWLPGGDVQASAGGEGRSLVVLLDISFSMGFEDRWERAKEAADSALQEVSPADEASIVVFSDAATVLGEPSSDPALLSQTLSTVELSFRKTRYGPALRMARKIHHVTDDFDAMYRDKDTLTKFAHNHLKENDFMYPSGQRAPEDVIELIEREG